MSLYLYFDNHKEYMEINGQFLDFPVGKAFIDFIELDFLKRDFFNPNIIDNPFVKFFSDWDDINKNKEYIADVSIKYKLATQYVLSLEMPEFYELNAMTRFHLYQKYFQPNITNLSIETNFFWKVEKTTSPLPNVTLENFSDPEILKKLAQSVKDFSFNIMEVYKVNNLEEALHISFMKMISNNIKVKKCKCCDKYFIPEGRIDTEYCSRLAPNSTKTCIEIGAIKKYHEKNKDNPITKEFQKQYKKMNSRVRIKKITQDSFYNWSEKARELRDRAIQENMSFDEFKDEFDKLEV